jgi:dual specificity protein kinase YAK1
MSVNCEFYYDASHNPVRIFTRPPEPVSNEGFDNCNSDYILKVSERIVSPEHQQYIIIDELGKGTFGQVVKCLKIGGELVALKVIKNKPAYFTQGLMEVKILQKLNRSLDPANEHHIIRMLDYFVFRGHLVIVFELLNYTVLDLLKQNSFKGFSLRVTCMITAQVLDCLCVLEEGRLIHCDLKPENIMFKLR